jgi:hypothetical protein
MMSDSAEHEMRVGEPKQAGDQEDWEIRMERPVRREGSGQYMVYVLVSFVVSVSATRLFLSISSYIRLGGGEIHISHILWGGLFLFVASLLPLLFSNRRIYKLSAIFSGVGIGLFIDEVGKFITSQNDYFYPLAAPIIYIFFMLYLILVIRLQRQTRRTPRSELHRALENLQDWIDTPLTDTNEIVLMERLRNISANAGPGHVSDLASSILQVVQTDSRPAALEKPTLMQVLNARFSRWISERGLRLLIAFAFLLMTFIAVKNPVGDLLNVYLPQSWASGFFSTHTGRWFGFESAPGLYQTRVVMEVVLGVLLLVSSLLLVFRVTRLAIPLGFGILIFYLTAIDPLLFFFEQFSTIVFVGFQYLLLAALIYYRTHFLPKIKE